MKILIVGTGAVGGYFGAKLALAGHAVTFLARGAHARAIRDQGLAVDAPDGEMLARGPVIETIEAGAGLGVDLALVTVKARSLPEIARGVGRSLGPQGVAVPLLNGVDSEEVLASAIGSARVVGGVANIAASVVGPGRVSVLGGGRILLAPLDPSDLPRAERLAAELSKAGFPCKARSDLKRVLWQKLLWNAPFNAVCALTRRTAGGALEIPALDALIRDAMAEVIAVANAEGVALDSSEIDSSMEGTSKSYAFTVPSMLQDVLAGRDTEAETLQGAVVAAGARHRIPTPVHRVLLALMRGLAPRERPSSS